jgi:hypothetical protein
MSKSVKYNVVETYYIKDIPNIGEVKEEHFYSDCCPLSVLESIKDNDIIVLVVNPMNVNDSRIIAYNSETKVIHVTCRDYTFIHKMWLAGTPV